MNNEQQPCTRDHLECYLIQSLLFTVSDDGRGYEFLDTSEYDVRDVDEYRCANCGQNWPVSNKYDSSARAIAWQAALDHLPTVNTSDGRLVRVELA